MWTSTLSFKYYFGIWNTLGIWISQQIDQTYSKRIYIRHILDIFCTILIISLSISHIFIIFLFEDMLAKLLSSSSLWRKRRKFPIHLQEKKMLRRATNLRCWCTPMEICGCRESSLSQARLWSLEKLCRLCLNRWKFSSPLSDIFRPPW